MRNTLVAASAVVAALAFGAHGQALRASDPQDLTVHEWGTFTSVAGEDGQALEWIPQAGPYDLPCFVDQLFFRVKGLLWGTVRMETPVLYFYSPRETTVDVRVRFPRGLLTEWYPKSLVTPAAITPSMVRSTDVEGTLSWTGVRVTPDTSPSFPVERGPSHYYVARQTDASPVLVGAQQEKFLFYRGVGRFAPPLTATIRPEGAIRVAAHAGSVGDVIVFENRGGRRAHYLAHVRGADATLVPMPEGEGSVEDDLHSLLVDHGLFEKEAKAMIDTWKDSWFDNGTRVFYVLSGKQVDDYLPLEIRPAPSQVARVFVGRIEMVTPYVVREIEEALNRADHATVRKHERFLQVIVDRILKGTDAAGRQRLEARLQAFYAARPSPAGCN